MTVYLIRACENELVSADDGTSFIAGLQWAALISAPLWAGLYALWVWL